MSEYPLPPIAAVPIERPRLEVFAEEPRFPVLTEFACRLASLAELLPEAPVPIERPRLEERAGLFIEGVRDVLVE